MGPTTTGVAGSWSREGTYSRHLAGLEWNARLSFKFTRKEAESPRLKGTDMLSKSWSDGTKNADAL